MFSSKLPVLASRLALGGALAGALGLVALSAAAAGKPAASSDVAEAPPAASVPAQRSKMKTCNAEAKGKHGDERKSFMKQCLSKKGAASQAS